jgi:hypothetical protein
MTQQLDELFFSEGKLDLSREDDYIWKTVLRTGQWALTPKGAAATRKPLVVVRDGESDPENNIVSLAQIVSSFDAEAFEHVTVPLAQNVAEGDHSDIARNNTGFIRALKIVDEDGVSKLKAAFDFTEPDIKERVERGTIPNTSVGLLYDFVRKSDAKKFPIALAHVALTHRPWIDKMEPFGIEAAVAEATDIASFEPLEGTDNEPWSDKEGLAYLSERIAETIKKSGLNDSFEVSDVAPGRVKIFNKAAGIEWVTTYSMDDGVAVIPPINEWKLTETKPVEIEDESNEEEGEEETPELEAPAAPILDPNNLQDASLLRESRFAQGNNLTKRGLNMSDELKSLNLSELPDEVRAAVEALQTKNRELERTTRSAKVEERVNQMGEELGLSEAPGFLKVVRQIMLSDDGEVAALLLADDGKTVESKATATDIVEKLVNALPKSEETGKILLSAQVDLAAGEEIHEKPAKTDDKPLDERLKEAREALGKPVE